MRGCSGCIASWKSETRRCARCCSGGGPHDATRLGHPLRELTPRRVRGRWQRGRRRCCARRMSEVENLREAVTFLALAEFRATRIWSGTSTQGRTIRLEPVPQWFWARLGRRRRGNTTRWPGRACRCRATRCSTRRGLFIARSFRADRRDRGDRACAASLSQKDWDGFVETYGLPPLFLELPAGHSAERETEYQAQAEAIMATRAARCRTGRDPHGRFRCARTKSVRGASALPGRADRAGGDGREADRADGSGSGTLAGSAHQQAFDDLARPKRRLISEIFQQQFDAPLLGEDIFRASRSLAYFELAATRELDPDE